jgi:hypothetical protein
MKIVDPNKRKRSNSKLWDLIVEENKEIIGHALEFLVHRTHDGGHDALHGPHG